MRRLHAPVFVLVFSSACGVLLDQSGDDPVGPQPAPDAASDANDDVDPKDASGGSDGESTEDGGSDASFDASLGCANPPCERYVFVTSVQYLGDLGGVAGADAKCMALASAAQPPIQGRAFIAYIASNVGANPSGGARLETSGPPFRRTDGVLVAATTEIFLAGPLKAAINRDEKKILSGIPGVWTGMNIGGTPSSSDCDGWTSGVQDFFGTYGVVALTGSAGWVDNGTVQCNEPRRLYCVEP